MLILPSGVNLTVSSPKVLYKRIKEHMVFPRTLFRLTKCIFIFKYAKYLSLVSTSTKFGSLRLLLIKDIFLKIFTIELKGDNTTDSFTSRRVKNDEKVFEKS